MQKSMHKEVKKTCDKIVNKNDNMWAIKATNIQTFPRLGNIDKEFVQYVTFIDHSAISQFQMGA